MNRQDIYERVEEIRAEQDVKWPRNEKRKQMYAFAPAHILIIEKHIEKLKDGWYVNQADFMERFYRIAACAVRALEEIKDAE